MARVRCLRSTRVPLSCDWLDLSDHSHEVALRNGSEESIGQRWPFRHWPLLSVAGIHLGLSRRSNVRPRRSIGDFVAKSKLEPFEEQQTWPASYFRSSPSLRRSACHITVSAPQSPLAARSQTSAHLVVISAMRSLVMVELTSGKAAAWVDLDLSKVVPAGQELVVEFVSTWRGSP
jgi:hypothetical protein